MDGKEGGPVEVKLRSRLMGAACATTGGVVHVAKRCKTEVLAGLRARIAACVKRMTDTKWDGEPLRAGRQTAVSAGSELAAGGVMYTLSACRSREKVTPVNPCLTGQLR